MKFLFLSNFKIYSHEYWTALSASFMMLAAGLCVGWFPPNLLTLSQRFNIPQTDVLQLPVYYQLANVPGILISNILSNAFGRKTASIISTIPLILGNLALLVSSDPIVLQINRILTGLTGGAVFTCIPTYVCEIASPKNRGILSNIVIFNLYFGILLESIFVPILSFQLNTIFCLVFGLIFICLAIFLPETPYWLISKNKLNKAENSLKFLRKTFDVEQEILDIHNSIEIENQNKGTLFDLIRVPTNRKALLIVSFIFCTQQLCGCGAIIQYSQDILKKTKSTVISTELSGVLYMIANPFFSFLFTPLNVIYGRRTLLIISILIIGLCMLCLGIFFYLQYLDLTGLTTSLQLLPLVCLVLFSAGFSLGFSGPAYAFMTEVFPTNVRSLGSSVISLIGAICGLINISLYSFCTANFEFFTVFFVFFFFCVIGFIGFFLFLFETNGLTLEEIQKQLKGKSLKN